MGEADTFESKRRIDHSLNVVIEQAGSRVLNLYLCPSYISLMKFLDRTFHRCHHRTFTKTL